MPRKRLPPPARRQRRLLALAAFVLVSASPPPADPYSAGVAARHAGETARAIELLERAVAAEPENADAHLQLGLALMAAGRRSEAEAALRRTLELAPNYEDARAALARLHASPEQLEYRWRADLDGSYSSLDGQRDWREGSVQLRYQASDETAVGAAVEASNRFGQSDVYGELRVEQLLSEGTSAYVIAGGTPDADFRPRWQVGAGVSTRVRSGKAATVLTLDARQARYRSGDIQTVNPGVEQYVAGGRGWITARWINIFDERGKHRSGWLVRGDAMASDRVRLFAGAADAPDVSEGVVIPTRSLFGGVSFDLDRRTTLRFSAAREDRRGGADRVQLGVGLGLRF